MQSFEQLPYPDRRSYYFIARNNDSLRLYIGDFADYAEALAYAANVEGFHSRDWRVGSISGSEVSR